MATSDINVFDFLGRTSNLVGVGSAIAALGAGVVATNSPILAAGAAAIGYAGGFLLSSSSKTSIAIGQEDEKVELATLQRNIGALSQTISEHSRELPQSIIDAMDEIFEVLNEILPKWKKLDSFNEDKYTINSILTTYLPTTLSNYMNLPKSYARSSKAAKLEAEILEQINVMSVALVDVRDKLYKGVESNISEQSIFLRNKFAKSTLVL